MSFVNPLNLNFDRVPRQTHFGFFIPFHSDPEHFPEPDKFLPERFDDLEVRNSPVYLPFGSGPRVCIGMRFASVQVRLALFHIVKNFRLSVSPNHKPIVVSPLGFMLVPIDGLLVNFEQRERD